VPGLDSAGQRPEAHPTRPPLRTSATAALLAAALLAGCATARGTPDGAAPDPAASGPATTWERLEPLGPLATALLFHQRADVPYPEEQLAASLPGVCRVADAEARQVALDGAWERLRQADRAARARRRWLVSMPIALGGYDLRRAGFPTGVGRDGGPRYDRLQFCGQEGLSYGVDLVNWRAFDLVPVPEDRARAFVRANMQRQVDLDLEVEPVGAEAGPTRVVLFRILRLRVRDSVGGDVLGEAGSR
jgi:hypothetical protein